MSKEQLLLEAIKTCLTDWDGDFDIDVEQEEHYGGGDYFSVIVAHKYLGSDYEFTARVGSSGEVEMNYYEDCWQPLDTGNLFISMWFFETTKR